MSITYVGGRQAGFAGTLSAQTIALTGLTGGIDTQPRPGDMVIITYFVGSTVDRSLAIRNTSAVDYTLMGSELTQSDTFDANQRTAYRFMPAGNETQAVLTETVGGGTGAVASAGHYTIHVYRGVDPSTPMDVTVTTAGAISSSAVDPPSILPTTAGAWVYAAGGAASGTGSVMTSSDLAAFLAGTTSDTEDASVGAGHFVWTSGAFNAAAFGNIPGGTTANSWTALAAALRPANFVETTEPDDAWSGAEGKSGAILSAKLAIGAAAVAAALAHGVLQQADDLPREPLVHGHDSIQVAAIGSDPVPRAFTADDEIVPQPAPAALDESYPWAPETWPTKVTIVNWPVVGGQAPVVTQFVDEEYWQPQLPASCRPFVHPQHATDEITQQPPAFVPDESLWSHQPALVKPFVPLWQVADELTQQAAFSPEEEYWFEPIARPVEIAVVNWPVTGGQGTPAVVVDAVEEHYWQAPQHQVRKPLPRLAFETDEVTQQPPAFTADEDGWARPWSLTAKPTVTLWRVEDEIPYAASDIVPVGSSAQRAVYKPTVLRWFGGGDDLPQPAVPLNVDEAYEPSLTSIRRPPQVTTWRVEDERPEPAVPLNVDEAYEPSLTSIRRPPLVTTWRVEDERPEPAVPLQVDEDYQPSLVSVPRAPRVSIWQVDDERPEPPLQVDEFYEPRLFSITRAPLVTTWRVEDERPQPAVPLEVLEWEWQVQVPDYVAPTVTLFQDDQLIVPQVPPPVYGWGARGRIGGTARDPWSRIGSEAARDGNEGIGSAVAKDGNDGIGSDEA